MSAKNNKASTDANTEITVSANLLVTAFFMWVNVVTSTKNIEIDNIDKELHLIKHKKFCDKST